MTRKQKDNDKKGKPTPIIGMRPGGPNNPDPGYTAGPDAGGEVQGGESAAELTGSGVGGDIDLPDVSGRGSMTDVAKHPDEDEGT